MQIDKARRVRDLAQEVVRLIDAATARAHRDREATNEHYDRLGRDPLTSPPDLAYSKEASSLRRRSLDLTRALAEMRKP